jgi:hypothetical protein
MTQGRARQTHGRENGHDHIARHRLGGASARRRRIPLQTQGVSRRGGGRSLGSFAPFTAHISPHKLSPACARRVETAHAIAEFLPPATSRGLSDTRQHAPASIQPPRRLTRGVPCPSVLRHTAPRTVGPCGRYVENAAAVGDVRRVCARRGRPVLGANRPRADRARHPADVRAESLRDTGANLVASNPDAPGWARGDPADCRS